jgi:hypothetical protein
VRKVGGGGPKIPTRQVGSDDLASKKKAQAGDTPQAGAPAPDAMSTGAQQALRALALDTKAENTSEKNKGAEASGLGARLMNAFRGEAAKKAYAVAGLGISLLGMAQPASADVVLVEQQNANQHMQNVARQLAGETGEGYIQVKSDAQALDTLFSQLNDGNQFAEHLILEAGPGGVDVDQLKELKQKYPSAFEDVRYVHVIGEDVGADPLKGEGKALFENAVGIVGFEVKDAKTAGPASSWLVQESGRDLYDMPGNGLSPTDAMIQARSIANQANRMGVDASVQVQDQKVVQDAQTDKPDLVLTHTEARRQNSSEIMFTVPSHMRNVKDGQSVLIPLEGGRTMHMVELKYQDTRKLRDLEFNRRTPGGQWETFRGDEYHSTVQQEKAGELQVKRESDHNAPWINNPIRVKVEIVDADGNVIQNVGKKFLDFHVHDAHSPDSSGYPETDNINNSYENLPKGDLPAGAMLRLTPMHENRKAWEADRDVAMNLSWVKPIYMPQHTERAMVRQGGWEKPNSAGYDVEAGRPIAGVFVKWTDHGGMASGSVSIKTDNGVHRSQRYNVGSGETELIPLDGVVSQDGKIYINGGGLEVGNIEVMYQ